MNSEELSRRTSEPMAEGLRRSKRISETERKICPPKVAKKNDEKPTKKSPIKANITPGNKARRGRPHKTKESSNSFDGSYLTPEELQHLFIKYKRDGHFRVNPPNISPPPIVISRTTDGKLVTTKIECYEPERQYVRDFASSFTGGGTEREALRKTSDRTSVTFSTPLTEDPAGNFISTCTNPPLTISPKDKPIFKVPPSNTWIPHNQSAQGTRNNSNTHLPGNPHSKNTSGGDGANRTSRRNAKENQRPNLDTQLQPTLYNYTNSNEARIRSPSYQQRQTNARSSAVPLQNSAFPFQNLNDPLQSSTFPLQNSIDPLQNLTFPLPNSCGPLQSSTFPLRNSTLPLQSSNFPLQNPTFSPQNPLNMNNARNAGNTLAMPNNAIFLPGNANSYPSPESMNSGYHSSYTPWNNDQWLQNWYNSTTNPALYNCCDASNAQRRCETATRPLIDDQGCAGSQINSWPRNNQPGKDFCETNSNVVRNNSKDLTITTSDNKELMEEAVFAVGGLEDPQNSGLCPTVSSSSFDDDISYNSYMGGNMSYNEANFEQATQENQYSSGLPSIMSLKTEMTTWYDGNSYYPGNNYQSNGVVSSNMKSFETKDDDNVDSADCYIIEEFSKT